MLFGTSAHPAVRQRADRFLFHHKKTFIPKEQQSPMEVICRKKNAKVDFIFQEFHLKKNYFQFEAIKECILHVFKICGIRRVN